MECVRRVAGSIRKTSQRDSPLAREFPLTLITPANHYFLNSIFANVTKQRQRAGAATLLIHPDDAAPRRITEGDDVRVANSRGSFFAVAEVSDGIRPGAVASTKGRRPGDSKIAQRSTLLSTSATRAWAAAPFIMTTACASTRRTDLRVVMLTTSLADLYHSADRRQV